MFERYLADALASHFGHLIENFDADKVRISVWNGAVVLKDLRLRSDALQHILQKSKEKQGSSPSSNSDEGDVFPCDIVYGHIGKFELHIPWSVFRGWGRGGNNAKKADGSNEKDSSGAYSVILSDVKILITQGNPHEKKRQDRNKEEDFIKKRVEKEKMVQAILDSALFRKNMEIASVMQNQQQQSSDMNDDGKAGSKKQWAKNLVKGIISNLCVTIRNVHVRYEDLGEGRNNNHQRPPFAIGVTLAEFSLSTTKNGPLEEKELFDIPSIKNYDMPGRVVTEVEGISPDYNSDCANDGSYSVQHKLAAMKSLAVYWDSDVSSKNLVHATVVQMRRLKKKKDDVISDHISEHQLNGTHDTEEQREQVCDTSKHDDLIQTEEDNILYSSMLNDIVGDSVGSQREGLDIFHNAQSSLIDCWGHTYIIKPISPSLHFTIVSATGSEKADNLAGAKSFDTTAETDQDVSCSNLLVDSAKKIDSAQRKMVQPPSRAVLTLPPLEVNVTKDALEDIAHIRKSVAQWHDMRTSFLSKQVFQQLTKARPSVSPMSDPIGWWRYSFEAIRIFSKLTSPKSDIRHRKGWLGLTMLLKWRKEYVLLYKKLLENNVSSSEKEHLSEMISVLEDKLDPSEIAAFRLHLFFEPSKIKEDESCGTMDNLSSCKTSASWTGWIYTRGETQAKNGDKNGSEANQAIIYTSKEILSHEYRESIYLEMFRLSKLEREVNYEELYRRKGGDEYQKPGHLGFENGNSRDSKLEISIVCPQLILQADDVIRENKFHAETQTHKSVRRRCQPIVQISCASVQKVCLRRDLSWDANCTFASLEILDLMESTRASEMGISHPKLLSRKRGITSDCYSSDGNAFDEKPIQIDGVSHFHSATIFARKVLQHSEDSSIESSDHPPNFMTSINIKISPMEAVYSYESFEALSQMFSTANNAEFAGDYQRLKHVISGWKATQQRRLLEVLAKQEKKVVINIDVAAPVLLIHDETSDETLVIDLGRLTFCNVDNSNTEKFKQYDDTWKLLLENIEVFSASFLDKKRLISIRNQSEQRENMCHLVEPFSIEFIIKTKIGSSDWKKEDGSTETKDSILIKATLPRLVFNLQSSSVRLVQRLVIDRDFRILRFNRQKTISTPTVRNNMTQHSPSFIKLNQKQVDDKQTQIEFNFSAPIIALRFSNNVDEGNGSPANFEQDKTTRKTETSATPIIDLAVHGIGGRFKHTNTVRDGKITNFVAGIKSLYAKDLYQQAGPDFSMILSSRSEPLYVGKSPLSSTWYFDVTDDTKWGGKPGLESDLVGLRYNSHDKDDLSAIESNLHIKFHELYVNWNPETIATVQKAMRLSLKEKELMSHIHMKVAMPRLPPFVEVDMEFFDTMESAETCSLNKDRCFLSESSMESSACSPHELNPVDLLPKQVLSPLVIKAITAMGTQYNTTDRDFLEQCGVDNGESNIAFEDVSMHVIPSSILKVTFQLSKLRIQFNKESRHRRLITAEMSELIVTKEGKIHGGSKINANVRNIIFYDPSSRTGSTLYGQILGLKAEDAQGSMLEICYETYPRVSNDLMHNCSKSVHIDADNRLVTGCDSAVSFRFSPMRFVILQQLWLEIIDYFFQGIMGYEVWGRFDQNYSNDMEKKQDDHSNAKQAPSGDDALDEGALPGADACGIRFMRISVVMESPVVLLPAHYRSTSYLRFDFSSIEISNEFNGQIEQNLDSRDNPDITRSPHVQWYNNYCISFSGLNLMSWCGTQLNIPSDPKIATTTNGEELSSAIDFTLDLRWPIGPTAIFVIPKWNVHFRIGSFRLLFRRDDYVLFQHILWYNIGEESRHLDEWNALQVLPPERLLEYKKRIMVHFGYDKKDSAPTTFNFIIDVESIIIHFCHGMNQHVADVTCSRLMWSLLKKKDRVSRQRLTCDSIHLVQTSGNKEWSRFETLLFPFEESPDSASEQVRSPQMVYTSTSCPNGNNVKYLEVNNACIYVIYPAWVFIKKFFQDLPEPDLMNNEEVLSCVEVADRWYRINPHQTVGGTVKGQKEKEEQYPKNAILPDFQFRMVLTSPHIVLVSDSSISDKEESKECKILTLQLSRLDFLHSNNPSLGLIAKSLFVHDLELFTGDPIRKDSCSQEHSLLYPLCFAGGLKSNVDHNGKTTDCCKWVASDVISARAAFTDMTLAVDVILNAMSDFSVVQHDSKPDPISTIQYDNENLAAEIANSSHDLSQKELATQIVSSTNELSEQDLTTQTTLSNIQVKEYIGFACGGFDLVVIDDSGRHFAAAVELVQIGLSGIKINRSEGFNDIEHDIVTQLQLHQFEMNDLLQPVHSPFRVVAIGNQEANASESPLIDNVTESRNFNNKKRWQKMNRTIWTDFMTKEKHSMNEHESWGYCPSSFMLDRYRVVRRFNIGADVDVTGPSLVELKHTSFFDNNKKSSVLFKIRAIVAQWNPSMAIALQRFLGRLKKEARSKQLISENSVEASSKNGTQNGHNSGSVSIEDVGHLRSKPGASKDRFQAKIEIDSFTLCLNKEHQRRRLLQVTLSNSVVNFDRDQLAQMNINGSVGDLSVWDSDGDRDGQTPISDTNRMVLRVIHNHSGTTITPSRFNRFLSFRYYCQPQNDDNGNISFRSAEMNGRVEMPPPWVMTMVGKGTPAEDIDDCLSLEVATVRVNYIHERTREIIDYLSNGLPGKGMGATAAKAKGFIKKRIKTRSFLDLSIDAPELLIPRQRDSKDSVFLCLGNVHMRSWFDEATLHESEAINCEQLNHESQWTSSPLNSLPPVNSSASINTIDPKYWWRALSISILGLSWQINTLEHKSQKSETPVSMHLLLRKPPSNDIPMIVRCRLLFTECVLTYREYVVLRKVLRDNLTKTLDKTLWDNVEKALFKKESTLLDESQNRPSNVEYSKSARFVRYGAMPQRDSALNPAPTTQTFDPKTEQLPSTDEDNHHHSTPLDLKIQLDSLHLTLHRDDSIPNLLSNKEAQNLNYDMVVFQVEKVKVSLSIDCEGGKMSTMNFYQVGLFDVGDKGRLARDQCSLKLGRSICNPSSRDGIIRKPSAFSAICFSGDELETTHEMDDDEESNIREPELKITIKICPYSVGKLGSSTAVGRQGEVVAICVEIKYMNINLLMRPLLEVADFFSCKCKWSLEDKEEFRVVDTVQTSLDNVQVNASKDTRKTGGFKVKFIAHYPSIFFLADESDFSTKALVLRGLAVVNASMIRENKSTASDLPVDKSDPCLQDIQSMTSIEAHFHSLESYINPNAMSILGRIRHSTMHNVTHERAPISGPSLSMPQNLIPKAEFDKCSRNLLGVALIEPVTATFEFHEEKRGESFPVIRTAYVNMEPVSTTFSFEDIRLIDAVISRWKTEKGWQKEEASNECVEIPNKTDIVRQDDSLVFDEVLLNDSDVSNKESLDDVVGEAKSIVRQKIICQNGKGKHCLCCEHLIPGAATGPINDNSGNFIVEFHSKKLGLVLRKSGPSIVVDKANATDYLKDIHRGDEILSIGERDISGMPLQSIVEYLRTTPRPTIIKFHRKVDIREGACLSMDTSLESLNSGLYCNSNNSSDGKLHVSKDMSIDDLPAQKTNIPIIPITMTFYSGVELGLQLEPSVCGDVAVVTKLDYGHFKASLLEVQDHYYRPKPGAVILALGDKSALELGYEGTVSFIQSKSELEESDSHFKVTFLEPSSNDWGPVETIDIVVQGFKVILIDDINGRDMPLLRGSLKPIAVKLERGLGLDCESIKVSPPSLFRLNQMELCHPDFIKSKENNDDDNSLYVTSDLSEIILKLSTTSEIELDYYNARIGSWEPIIEPCRLSAELERQKGNDYGPTPRPTSISLVISDYCALLNGESLQQSLVCINITDAAAELLLTAAYELKSWKRRYKLGGYSESILALKNVASQGEQSFAHGIQHNNTSLAQHDIGDTNNTVTEIQITQNVDNPEHETGRQRVAAQNAARAALIFAQRRGADSQKVCEAKPFIFKNETGMCISYVPQTPGNSIEEMTTLETWYDLRAYKNSAIKEVNDGEEACFSMDPVKSDDFELSFSNNLEASIRDNKKVRTYDGQFPLLSVLIRSFDSDVDVEIMRDMSVVKSGQHLKRLRMRKTFKRQRLIDGNEEELFETGFVLVVWSVTLENNRRIITLSSAVSIASPDCGIPIEIGVKQYHNETVKGAKVVNDDIVDIKDIRSIGFSTVDSPFSLPIWLDVCFKSAHIFVRPVSECNITDSIYQWSSKNILKFERAESPNLSFSKVGDPTVWTWQPNETSYQLCCHPQTRPNCTNHLLLPAWLSWSQRLNNLGRAKVIANNSSKGNLPNTVESERRYNTICISISSGMRIRNTVPDKVEWEISSGIHDKPKEASVEDTPTILDGSSCRRHQKKTIGFIPFVTSSVEDECQLESGHVTDVFCCDMSSKATHVRFRCSSEREWSEWSLIHLPASKLYNDQYSGRGGSRHKEQTTSSRVEELYQSRQINIQPKTNFGPIPPSTFGLKVVPNVSIHVQGTRQIRIITGYDLILFTKLWFCNFTHLNLVFGAPSTEINFRKKACARVHGAAYDTGNKIAAEAAIMEISSILEFGDKGTSREGDDSCYRGDVSIISKQQSNEAVDEVFEYVEIHHGNVKRRWWASEIHSSLAHSPSAYDCLDGTEWVWADRYWQIDNSGACHTNQGGWESCLNLVGGRGRSFSGQRQFLASHPFRRRRLYRRRIKYGSTNLGGKSARLNPPFHLNNVPGIGTTAFHHPCTSREVAHNANEKNDGSENGKTTSFLDVVAKDIVEDSSFKIYFKIGDGRWSDPAVIPSSGTTHGVVRVFASRWPGIKNISSPSEQENSGLTELPLIFNENSEYAFEAKIHRGCQSQVCYELSYHVSVIEGPWGELSRSLTLHPRFFVRNDSKSAVYVKQIGSEDFSSIRVEGGDVFPFYWADTNLPELICVRPVSIKLKSRNLHHNSRKKKFYRWSGGFDPCNLGMIPLRIRGVGIGIKKDRRKHSTYSSADGNPLMKVVRALIEIRSGTGGTGIIVSFKEELPNGEDSLYRIENHTPFPIWIAQDGVLANPSHNINLMSIPESLHAAIGNQKSRHHSQGNEDLVSPMQHLSFGLDVPFRQGKYAGRSAASLEELLRIRVGLAPLTTRDGVESTKVIGLSYVGENIHLKPCMLRSYLEEDTRAEISCIRVRGLVCTDGPTRVLKFSLVQRNARIALRNSIGVHIKSQPVTMKGTELCDKMKTAAKKTIRLLHDNKIPKEHDNGSIREKSETQSNRLINIEPKEAKTQNSSIVMGDSVYSVAASFSGFVFSLIDDVPTEIALISLRKVQVMAEWSLNRSTEATAVLSIGWVQIDNHCPNAPFPIALCPDGRTYDVDNDEQENKSPPFLSVGIVFAPCHKSGIMCLKGVSIDPRDVAISTDLGFIFRVQSFLLGLHEHIDCCQRKHDQADLSTNESSSNNIWNFPDFHSREILTLRSTATSIEMKKFYFEGITILPITIKLSVAPTVALTSAQASLEGNEAAQMHAAVRKGDVLISDGVGVLGVKLGTKNQTTLAVIQGVFKSILVDGLLRCDGASMEFHGVGIHNHLSTGPQLKTILGAHYVTSLKRNVPALLGSLAAFGNPVGLIRGFGDGVNDFVNEPVKGIKRSLDEGDPTYAIDGVARGAGSLARHTVGGIADFASLLSSTFSKNLSVLTLDRTYAHRRDHLKTLSTNSTTFFEGVESGVTKLIGGIAQGVIGVIRAPMRGAERDGVTGFAKGVGKGVLGLVIKPVIGLSDTVTDVMDGVKGSIEGADKSTRSQSNSQIRFKRPFYGPDRVFRRFESADAIAADYMMCTKLAGDNFLSHCDMGGRVAILSVKSFLLLEGRDAQLFIKLKHISHVDLRQVPKNDGRMESAECNWAVLIFLKFARKNGNEVEVIMTDDKNIAIDLCAKIKQGVNLVASI